MMVGKYRKARKKKNKFLRILLQGSLVVVIDYDGVSSLNNGSKRKKKKERINKQENKQKYKKKQRHDLPNQKYRYICLVLFPRNKTLLK